MVSIAVAASRPVGGVLSARPENRCRRGGHPSTRPTWGHRAGHPSHVWPCSGWGLPSRPGHPGRWCALAAPFHPCLCTASRAIGGLFSVALSCGSPRLAVSQHPALWSPDLPQPATAPKAPLRPRPPGRLATTGHSRTSPAVRSAARVFNYLILARPNGAAERFPIIKYLYIEKLSVILSTKISRKEVDRYVNAI